MTMTANSQAPVQRAKRATLLNYFLSSVRSALLFAVRCLRCSSFSEWGLQWPHFCPLFRGWSTYRDTKSGRSALRAY